MDFVLLLVMLINFCVLSLGMNNGELPEPAPEPAPAPASEAGPSGPPAIPETDFNVPLVSITEPAPAPAPEAGPSGPPAVPETDFNPSLVSITGPNAGEPHPGNQLLIINGLCAAPQHNGRRCWVLRWMYRRGRYEVILGPDEILNVRPQNLRLAGPADFRAVPANVFAYVDDDDDDVPLEPNQYRVIAYPDLLMFHPFALSADAHQEGAEVGVMMQNRDV